MIVLAAATAREMKSIRSGLAPLAADPLPIPAQGEALAATVAERKISFLVTGVGPINAALSLGALLAGRKDVQAVVNLGVAGSFDLKTHPLESIRVVCGEIWPEIGLATGEGVDPRGIGLAQAHTESGPVWDRLDLDPEAGARALGAELPGEWLHTLSLSVAGVTASPGKADGMRKRYRAGLENMEGFALAMGCLRHSLPLLEIRTVSNLVGSRPPDNWALEGALNQLAVVTQILFSVPVGSGSAPAQETCKSS